MKHVKIEIIFHVFRVKPPGFSRDFPKFRSLKFFQVPGILHREKAIIGYKRKGGAFYISSSGKLWKIVFRASYSNDPEIDSSERKLKEQELLFFAFFAQLFLVV